MKTLKFMMICVSACLMLATACNAGYSDEPGATVLPVVIEAPDGSQLLAGTYDMESSEIILVDSLRASMTRFIADNDLDPTSMAIHGVDWQGEFSLDSAVTALELAVDAGEPLSIVLERDGQVHVLWSLQIQSSDWTSTLTEAEAATRYPICDPPPDCEIFV